MDAIKTHNPFALNDMLFSRQTGVDLDRMNNYGCSLVWGHPQAPMGTRAVIELIEELALRGGGYGLFTGCAAGDSAMAVVHRSQRRIEAPWTWRIGSSGRRRSRRTASRSGSPDRTSTMPGLPDASGAASTGLPRSACSRATGWPISAAITRKCWRCCSPARAVAPSSLPLNWRLATPEHARVLADCTPRAILVDAAFAERAPALRDVHPGIVWTTLGDVPRAGPAGTILRQSPQRRSAQRLSGSLEDPVLLCYTSGSTGAPKGVVLTQSALFWNALNSAHMHDLTSADRILTTLPLFHVGGLNILTLPALHAGATVTLHAQFEPLAAIEAIERERITLTVLVPAQLTAMMEHPRWRQADLSSLRMITTGSTIVSQSFVRSVNARGLRLVQVYGSTETCPIAAYVRAENAERKAGDPPAFPRCIARCASSMTRAATSRRARTEKSWCAGRT